MACLICLQHGQSFAGSQKAPAPKVVFLGDNVTSTWGVPANSNAFQANPKWINRGLPRLQTSAQMLARFQPDVVNQHPAIVHILAGAVDVDLVDDANRSTLVQVFEESMMTMIAEAAHANIKVILGTIPPQLVATTVEQPQPWLVFEPTLTAEINGWIENYGSANKIEVINYHDVLCACVGSTNPARSGFYPLMGNNGTTPSPAGYAVMTQLVNSAISTLDLTLDSGYVTNPGSQHSVAEGGILQFTAYGFYSDGIPRAMLNPNFAGVTGTWSSDNTSALYVGYNGEAFALAPGAAVVEFTSSGGVRFASWAVTVAPAF